MARIRKQSPYPFKESSLCVLSNRLALHLNNIKEIMDDMSTLIFFDKLHLK